MSRHEDKLAVVHLGRMSYTRALEIQKRAVDKVLATRRSEPPREWLLLVEHDPPVITVGRGAGDGHVTVSRERLAQLGVELHETSRGGDVTWHGPGQLVAYPILDLMRHGRDVHGYLRRLERTVIDLLAEYDLTGSRDSQYTGVWVGREKICAIGVAITRWVTYHGLALNVSADLSGFSLIVPCGIRDRGVTSLEKLLGRSVAMDAVAEQLTDTIVREFGFAGAEAASFEGL